MYFFKIRYLLGVLFQNVIQTLNFLFLLFALDFPIMKKKKIFYVRLYFPGVHMSLGNPLEPP